MQYSVKTFIGASKGSLLHVLDDGSGDDPNEGTPRSSQGSLEEFGKNTDQLQSLEDIDLKHLFTAGEYTVQRPHNA